MSRVSINDFCSVFNQIKYSNIIIMYIFVFPNKIIKTEQKPSFEIFIKLHIIISTTNSPSIGWWLVWLFRRSWRPWQIGLVRRRRCSWIPFPRPFLICWLVFVWIKLGNLKEKYLFSEKNIIVCRQM